MVSRENEGSLDYFVEVPAVVALLDERPDVVAVDLPRFES